MATLMRVPEVAAGTTEVVLSEWLVEEGAEVSSGATVAVVETEKAVVEIEADSTGVVLKRLVEAGATVEVGSPYAVVGAEGEDAETDTDTDTDTDTAPPAAEPEVSAAPDEPEPASAPESEPEPDPGPAAERPAAGEQRVFATPLARRLMAEAGLEPAQVPGSGPNGRITKKDVQAAAQQAAPEQAAPEQAAPERTAPEQAAAEPPAAADAPAGASAEPHSRLRRAVATRLSQSKREVPHFYLRRTARVDALLRLRGELNEVSTHKISVNDLVVRAVGVAHAVVPEANVTWSEEALLHHDGVDVGVAIASERGLVTPVVRDVDRLTPSGVARRVKELAAQADEGRLRQQDLEGGTISVTNLGMYGVEEFAAIINPPQSAILAVGAAQPTAVVEDGAVVVATTMALVLSVDHRAVDGALAARWLAALVAAIEEPLRLLA
ncbi:2-oxo acid dehydrogenase subunit E2 [Nocardioides mangrovicus]|uniref:Dihydrolipoamide acetyltransferase component of pyruvate dehydrogenase complex n=1 Tax=Nocardioides mangrovicus TaxID=2478913 RepID=A0A3L8NYW0_9ACTN|nr:dihydrolipoamide acetyltransferase family protein [Nocardioides mangrovicus]RLV47961.1 2-oxo acid dehydrogenase subunit E2 [Nocardioides mangrovicus]